MRRQRQPSPVGLHDTALHVQRSDSAGHPGGAQQIESGTDASLHCTSFGVADTTHEQLSPLPKEESVHFVLVREEGELQSARQRSSTHRAMPTREGAAALFSVASRSHVATSPPAHVSRLESVSPLQASSVQQASTSVWQRVTMHWPHGVEAFAKRQ